VAVPSHGPDCSTRMYTSRCKIRRREVYHFTCSHGSNLFFDRIEPFELHDLHAEAPSHDKPTSLRIRVGLSDQKLLRRLMKKAVTRWRRSSRPHSRPGNPVA